MLFILICVGGAIFVALKLPEALAHQRKLREQGTHGRCIDPLLFEDTLLYLPKSPQTPSWMKDGHLPWEYRNRQMLTRIHEDPDEDFASLLASPPPPREIPEWD